MSNFKSFKLIGVLIVLFVGAALRLYLLPITYGMIWPDSLAYYSHALSFVHPEQPYLHALSHTPIYPILLAHFLAVGEVREVGLWFIYFQQLLGVMSAVGIFLIGAEFLPLIVSLLGALAFVIHPLLIFYEMTVHTESLFIFVLVVLIAAIFWTLRAPNCARFVIIGLLCAVLTLVRPIAQFYVLLPVLGFFSVFTFREATKATLVIMVSLVTALTPWMVYNNHVHGFFGISQGKGNNLFYRLVDVDRILPHGHTNFPEVKVSFERHYKPDAKIYYLIRRDLESLPGVKPAEADQMQWGYALEILKRHPFRYLGHSALQVVEFFTDPLESITFCPSRGGKHFCCKRPKVHGHRFSAFPNFPPGGYSAQKKTLRFLADGVLLSTRLLGALALLGLIWFLVDRRYCEGRIEASILGLTLFYFLGICSLFNAPEDRYRLPVDWIVMLFAAFFIYATIAQAVSFVRRRNFAVGAC